MGISEKDIESAQQAFESLLESWEDGRELSHDFQVLALVTLTLVRAGRLTTDDLREMAQRCKHWAFSISKKQSV